MSVVYSRSMGLWGNIKSAFLAAEADVLKAHSLAGDAPESSTNLVRPTLGSRPRTALAGYEREKIEAAAAGQTVKGYRAGYINAEETKEALDAFQGAPTGLELVSSLNGLDLALPDGRLIDYKTLGLRRWNIFGFRGVGMAHYEDAKHRLKFRLGQSLRLEREPENEYDPNAVAIKVGTSARKIGYVNKQRARWIASVLDSGGELSVIVIQTKAASPRVLVAPPQTLEYLTRSGAS